MDLNTQDYFDKDSFEGIDYVASCDLLKNYSGMRILALGGAITLLVSLIAIDRGPSVLQNSIQNVILLLANYVSIRVIGSINSNVYARCLHLEWLEEKLRVVGFFSYWNQYVIDKSKNASSNAFILSCTGFNYLGSILVFIYSYQLIVNSPLILAESFYSVDLKNIYIINYLKILLLLIVMMFSIFTFIINRSYIEKNKTKKLIPRLRESLQRERDSVVRSKIKNVF